MNEKGITLEFDLDTGEVKSEAHNYDGQACSVDLGPILAAVGQEKARKPKLRTQTTRVGVKVGK